MMYNQQKVKEAILKKGYAWFDNGDYNLNIIGIRSTVTNKITNKFDDLLTLSYKTGNGETYKEYNITTDPGLYYSQNLLSPDGVAILVPGQYRGTWQIGLHQGKYEALVQRKAVKVFRDKNKDSTYDMLPATIKEGLFGINIHHSSSIGASQIVDKWSAGCQVFQDINNFNEFLALCKLASKAYGNSFTYTLLLDTDLS